MKRRTKTRKERENRKAEKLAGMKNPSGESQYALKKRGAAPPSAQKNRPSWFIRYHTDNNVHYAKRHG